MTDARLPGRWLTDPDLEALSDRSWRIHTGALMWSAEQGTDGRIFRRTMRLLHPEGASAEDAQPLIDAGLWEVEGEDFQILNWERTQTLAAAVEQTRERNRRNQARWRERERDRRSEQTSPRPRISAYESDDISAYAGGEDRRGEDSSPTSPDTSIPGAPPQAEDGDQFEQFWDIYPAHRRGAKKAVRTAWDEVKPPADVIPRLRAWIPTIKDPQYYPKAEKWLRERRWELVKAPTISPDQRAREIWERHGRPEEGTPGWDAFVAERDGERRAS